MLRPFSLPVRLALLVGGTMLPLILFSGAIIYSNYQQDRREAQDRVLQVIADTRQALESEMQGALAGMIVLANSRSLANQDFETFRISANAFIKQCDGDSAISIGDAEGRQLFNSSVAIGVPLPPRAPRPERDIVFRTGKPAFSPLFIGSVSKSPIVIISVPVYRDGKVVYDLSFSPPLRIFQRIIEQQRPSEDWTISIFDQTGANIARLPNPERNVGQRGSQQLLDRLFSSPNGVFPTVSREGVELLSAAEHSELTGWFAVSGIAERTLIGPALNASVLAATIGIVMLLIGLGFALRMASTIAN